MGETSQNSRKVMLRRLVSKACVEMTVRKMSPRSRVVNAMLFAKPKSLAN
jgi:hypothetical protein